jgi:hypothetical protein
MDKGLNYSPLKIGSSPNFSGNKEAEPKIMPKIEPKKEREVKVLGQEIETSKESNLDSQQAVNVVPELPELDEELKDMGVQLEDSDTIFVNSRKIELPIPLEEVHEGLHKPLNSGWRWLSEITKYILARFNIVIKKKGNKFKLVEQN